MGTDPRTTTAPFQDAYWRITNNAFASGYYGEPYRGGDSTASQLHNITQLDFANNTFPLCSGKYEERQPPSTCATPDEYEIDLNVITGGAIVGNNFAGSEGVVQPQPYDQDITAVTQCGNEVGVVDSTAEQASTTCASGTH